jgi:hypothetical protein
VYKQLDNKRKKYMPDSSFYLVNGTTSSTSGTQNTDGIKKFTVIFQGKHQGSNVATGTLSIKGRVAQDGDYVDIYSTTFAGNDNVTTQFYGPWESIMGHLADAPTGTFTIVCRGTTKS